MTAGQALAQTKDIMLLILDHLDSKDLTAILTTNRIFLWLGHDVLGRKTDHTLDEVTAMDPKTVSILMGESTPPNLLYIAGLLSSRTSVSGQPRSHARLCPHHLCPQDDPE